MRYLFALALLFILLDSVSMAGENQYIGSAACLDCHEKEYSNFIKFAKKADSFDHIKVMEKKLTPEEFKSCFSCHTTGYGKPGGFVSEDRTPDLKQPGCEVCHGPGRDHAQTQDPDLIVGSPTMESCTVCHDESRVGSFKFKPLLFGGAH